MSHSVPTASTAATYFVSEPRRLTLTCKTNLFIALSTNELTAEGVLWADIQHSQVTLDGQAQGVVLRHQ